MKRTLALLMIAEIALLGGRADASEPLDLFDSEQSAIAHCGDDAVVWLDVPANRYSYKDQPGYGANKEDGGYTCKRDADRSGNHPAQGTR
jgi:hypothetical protein